MFLFKRYYLAQSFIFILTFLSYAFLHANRKSFSNVKSTLKKVWTSETYNDSIPKLYPKNLWRENHFFPSENQAEVYLGVLDAIFMACYAVGLFISGYLGDRFNPRYVLGAGMCLSAVMIFLFGVVTEWCHLYNIYFYTIFFGLNGLCQSTGWPATVAIMGNWFGNARGFWLCLWSSCAYVGNILGDVLTGDVLPFGYQYGFLVPSVILFSGGLIVSFTVVTSPAELNGYSAQYQLVQQSDSEDLSVSIISNNDATKLSFLRIILIPGVIPYALAYACLKLVNYAFFFWLPVYLATFGLSNANADKLSIWYDVGSIIGGTVAGLLTDFMWSRSPVTVGSLVLTVVALGVYRVAPRGNWENQFFLAMIGVFIGGPANLISATISADLGCQPLLSGNRAALSSVTGVIDGTGSVGAAVGQLFVPLIEQWWSWGAVFVFFMVMITLSVICLLPVLIKDVLRLLRDRRTARERSTINDD